MMLSKRLLCFLFWENLLGMFSWVFFVLLCHCSPLKKINAQTLITAILPSYLIHEFLVNVKCRKDRSHKKSYICFLFDFLMQFYANGACLTSVNVGRKMLPPSSFFERVSFYLPDLCTETPWLDLRGMINFPGKATHIYHTIILWGYPKSRCSLRILIGCLPKSGPLDFATKNTFALFFVGEEALVGVY